MAGHRAGGSSTEWAEPALAAQPAAPVAPEPAPTQTGQPPELRLRLATRRVQRGLVIAVTVVVVLNLLASIGAGLGAPYSITRFFDGDSKINVPTGFKTSMLLAVTTLCGLLWTTGRRIRDPFTAGWKLLTLVAGFAFVDETIYLHQSISEVLHNHLNTGGVLTFAWTLIYLPAAVAAGIVLVFHLGRLGPVGRLPLLIGGALYVGGSVGLEPVKSALADGVGEGSLPFKLVACCSDSMQMFGLTVLVIVLLGHLRRRAGGIRISWGE